MKKIILRNINGKKVLLLFILTSLVYGFMLMVTIPKVMSFSDGMKLLDMMPAGYNLEYVNSFFNTLGEKGRDAYLFNQIPVDLIYPFLFGISNCLLMAYFLHKLNRLNGPLFYLCLLPLAAGILDYGENVGIITMLTNYPEISDLSVTTANIFTVSKSVVTSAYFVALIITLIALGVNALNRKNPTIEKGQ
ncbi:MAG: hypothetical protein ACE5FF_00500 [Saprospiraceae bacterium]